MTHRAPERFLAVALVGADAEDLLHAWLCRLHVAHELEGFFATGFDIEVRDRHLSGRVAGVRFDPTRDELFTEIKAVTRHGLRIERGDSGWSGEALFDV